MPKVTVLMHREGKLKHRNGKPWSDLHVYASRVRYVPAETEY